MLDDGAVVKVSNLFFEYEGGKKALENLSFDVNAGEFLAVLGANGAGKTTLCYILSGIIPNIYGGKRKGKIRVCDIDPWTKPIYETARNVGIVLQDPDAQLIMPEVKMELAFGPASLGVPKDEIMRRIDQALKIVGLEGCEDKNPKNLSGGQKQRVAIGAVLTMMPKVLILDEPTSQLDPVGTTEVLEALQEIRKHQNLTIIMATHKTEEIANLCDKVLILNEGKSAAYGGTSEVLTEVDMLEKCGVKPTMVASYFKSLSKELEESLKIPLTVDDAYPILRSLIENKKVEVEKDVEFVKEFSRREKPLIEIQNLTFVYPGSNSFAIKDVSLKIYEGEFIGIVGQNGSGKTTLVKNIMGLLKPKKGRILFRGDDVSKFTVAELAKKIGLVLQNPDYQLFTISAAKEIEFGLRNIGVPLKEINQRVKEALEIVRLTDEHETFPFRLSFGDRRKLAFAATVAMKPEVLIMDEPTTAQDYRGRYLLADLAKKMHEEGLTVIMITHDMELVARYTQRLIVMANGEILADGPTREVFQKKEVLNKAFLKPPQITQLAQKLSDTGVPGEILSVHEMQKVLRPARGVNVGVY
jgi:energy-coupling factor transport system ATP-binding protein